MKDQKVPRLDPYDGIPYGFQKQMAGMNRQQRRDFLRRNKKKIKAEKKAQERIP